MLPVPSLSSDYLSSSPPIPPPSHYRQLQQSYMQTNTFPSSLFQYTPNHAPIHTNVNTFIPPPNSLTATATSMLPQPLSQQMNNILSSVYSNRNPHYHNNSTVNINANTNNIANSDANANSVNVPTNSAPSSSSDPDFSASAPLPPPSTIPRSALPSLQSVIDQQSAAAAKSVAQAHQQEVTNLSTQIQVCRCL